MVRTSYDATFHEGVERQEPPAGVAHEDDAAAVPRGPEPRQEARSQDGVVAGVADEDDIDVRDVVVERIAARYTWRHAVGLRVQRDRGDREGIDVDCADRRRTGQEGGDRHQARSGGDIEDAPAGDGLGMIGDVAREREPASPGERPVRQAGIGIARRDLDVVPQRERLVSGGEVESDVRQPRDRLEPGMTTDERSMGDGHRRMLRHAKAPDPAWDQGPGLDERSVEALEEVVVHPLGDALAEAGAVDVCEAPGDAPRDRQSLKRSSFQGSALLL